MFLLVILALGGLLLCLLTFKSTPVKTDQRRAVKKNYQGLRKYLPEAAADYCVALWEEHDFTLRIKGSRKTKLGDFRVDRTGKKVSISVNGTLNQYAFVVTYLHEVAHLLTWQQHKSAVKPHGGEWQHNFQQLMQPMLTADVFPPEVLKPLKRYMLAPAASTAANQPLWIALRSFDEQTSENALFLGQIPDGNKFRFSETVYVKVEVRRTRALCQNLTNGRRYLISTAAQVELVA